MQIEGKIIKVLPVREGVTVNGKWRAQSYVLETEEAYPHRMTFDVFDGQDGRIARLNIQEGKRMSIFFAIDAHEFQGRWYNSIRAYDARGLN